MNEELQNALATLLAKTTSAAEAGVNFLQAELPDVIRQLLMWHAVRSAIFFVICAALILVVWRAAIRAEAKMVGQPYAMHGFGYVGASLASTVLAMFAAGNLTWLQIWIAPKVYLIEYAASLAK